MQIKRTGRKANVFAITAFFIVNSNNFHGVS
jgi:hypothetical protein